jgi:hypothetical protein
MPDEFSRRAFLGFSAFSILALQRGLSLTADKISGVPKDLDHVLLGSKDLDYGIAWLEKRSGVHAMVGGVHPGRGTRNALLALGERRYLEIIAPDPAQAGTHNPMVDGLHNMDQPRLIGWAAHTTDLNELMRRVAAAGIAMEEPRDGSRARPDGKLLRWRSFALKQDFGGLLPFFIEWNADSAHPSQDAPGGCSLQSFSVESPTAAAVTETAHKLGLDVKVKPGTSPVLRAHIVGKTGAFELS